MSYIVGLDSRKYFILFENLKFKFGSNLESKRRSVNYILSTCGILEKFGISYHLLCWLQFNPLSPTCFLANHLIMETHSTTRTWEAKSLYFNYMCKDMKVAKSKFSSWDNAWFFLLPECGWQMDEKVQCK